VQLLPRLGLCAGLRFALAPHERLITRINFQQAHDAKDLETARANVHLTVRLDIGNFGPLHGFIGTSS
jgi:hypothetical protein